MLSVGKTLISLPLEPLAKYPATLSGGKLVPGPLRTYYLVPRAYDLIGQRLGSYLKKRKPGYFARPLDCSRLYKGSAGSPRERARAHLHCVAGASVDFSAGSKNLSFFSQNFLATMARTYLACAPNLERFVL